MKGKYNFICLNWAFVFVQLLSCKHGVNLDVYYSSYVSFAKNTYLTKEVGNHIYMLQYRPKEFLALVDLKGTEEYLTQNRLNKAAKNYANDNHFCLRIMTKDSSDVLLNDTDESGFYNRIGLLNADLNQMIIGIDNNDTAFVSFHHFERTYKLQPYVQILFSLSKTQSFPNTILYKDEIFENGSFVIFEDCKKLYDEQLRLAL